MSYVMDAMELGTAPAMGGEYLRYESRLTRWTKQSFLVSYAHVAKKYSSKPSLGRNWPAFKTSHWAPTVVGTVAVVVESIGCEIGENDLVNETRVNEVVDCILIGGAKI